MSLNKVNSHEITRAETHEIYESNLPLIDYFNPLKYNSVIADRGPTYPLLVRALKKISYFKSNYALIRLASVVFFLTLSVLMIWKWRKNNGLLVALSAISLLFTNELLFYYISSISPYMLSVLLSFIIYCTFDRLNTENKRHIQHSLVSTVSVISFYITALPVVISLIMFCKKDKKSLKKYWYYYLPLILVLVVKGYMILLFRFHIRMGESGFYKRSIIDNLNYILEFFSLHMDAISINYSLLGYLTLTFYIVYFLSVLIFIIYLFITKGKDKLIIFTRYYLVFMIITYLAMSFSGAREIKMTYYIGLLPLFYVCYVNFYIKKIGIRWPLIFSIIIFAGNLTQYQKIYGQYQHIYYEPIETTYSFFKKIIKEKDLICFPQDLSYGEKLWNYVEGLNHVDNKTKKIFRTVNSCKKILKNKTKLNFENIYIVTWGNSFNPSQLCETMDLNNCPNKKLIDLIKFKNIKEIYSAPIVNKNNSIYISIMN